MDLTFQVPLQYCSNPAPITSPIHSWVLFLLWLHRFILSGVSSPLISNSILGTYQPGEFIFQCPIILLFHTVHGILKARILKWLAIPFSSGPRSVNQSIGKPQLIYSHIMFHGIIVLGFSSNHSAPASDLCIGSSLFPVCGSHVCVTMPVAIFMLFVWVHFSPSYHFIQSMGR